MKKLFVWCKDNSVIEITVADCAMCGNPESFLVPPNHYNKNIRLCSICAFKYIFFFSQSTLYDAIDLGKMAENFMLQLSSLNGSSFNEKTEIQSQTCPYCKWCDLSNCEACRNGNCPETCPYCAKCSRLRRTELSSLNGSSFYEKTEIQSQTCPYCKWCDLSNCGACRNGNCPETCPYCKW